MKKQLVSLSLLTGLSLAFLVFANCWVNSARGKIAMEETVLLGDKSAAEGFTVTYHTRDTAGHLFWDTACDLDGAEPDTAFRYVPDLRDDTAEEVFVNLYHGCYYNVIGSGGFDLLETKRYDHLLLEPAIQVASRTKAGEERTERLRLGDYCEYYPLGLSFTIDGEFYSLDEADSQDLGDYLRIPAPEEEELEVTIAKDKNGNVTNLFCGPAGKEYYDRSIDTRELVTEEGIYLLPCQYVQTTSIDKVTPLPCGAGTGIFFLPFREQPKDGTLEVDGARLLFPIVEGTDIRSLRVGAGGSRLLLCTREEGKLWLTVIDAADGTAHQRLDLMEMGKNDDVLLAYTGEDFLAVGLLHGGFLVVEEENGRYTPVLSGQMDPRREERDAVAQAQALLWYSQPVLLWDGERLAWAACISGARGFYAAVFDETGMTYLAQYACGLDREVSGSYQEQAIALSIALNNG